jgi:hypothetical protein
MSRQTSTSERITDNDFLISYSRFPIKKRFEPFARSVSNHAEKVRGKDNFLLEIQPGFCPGLYPGLCPEFYPGFPEVPRGFAGQKEAKGARRTRGQGRVLSSSYSALKL